jgi:bacterioferritin (cytochrome b1)
MNVLLQTMFLLVIFMCWYILQYSKHNHIEDDLVKNYHKIEKYPNRTVLVIESFDSLESLLTLIRNVLNQTIRLDELNKILDEMQQGESAVKRLQELDDSRGLQDPADVVRRMRGNKDATVNAPKGLQASGDALGDQAIAQNLRQQAAKMDAEAKGLMAEAQRLQKEAAQLEGIPAKETVAKPKKPTTKKTKVSV